MRRRGYPATFLKTHAVLALALLAACTDSCVRDDREVREDEGLSLTELSAQDVIARLWPPDAPKHYVDALEDRRIAIEVLVRTATRQASTELDLPLLDKLAKRAGFDVEHWRVDGRQYLALLESIEHRSGAGAYVLRVGPRIHPEREILLQAPHAFFDLGTGKLGVHVLLSAGDQVRGLFVNTLHRYAKEDGHRRTEDVNPADVCHNIDHPFVHATQAAALELDDVEVIQLHGFDRTGVRGAPEAIVSAGLAEGSSSRSAALAARLREAVGVEALRFPEDTRSLGATTNVEGKRLRELFGTSFIHVEMSKELREALARPERLVEFTQALLGSERPAAGSPAFAAQDGDAQRSVVQAAAAD